MSIDGAQGILFNVTGGPDLSLYEVNEAAEIIRRTADPDANIIFGAVIDPDMKDGIRITVIATGFDQSKRAALQTQRRRGKTPGLPEAHLRPGRPGHPGLPAPVGQAID